MRYLWREGTDYKKLKNFQRIRNRKSALAIALQR